MFFGISAYTILLFTASAMDISMSVCSSLFEASFVIIKDSSLSDNASILFVFLELIFVSSS